MSDSSDSDDYSSRVIQQNKNKKNDENLLATKNNFMKELQNHSNISHVAQKSFLQANESFVNEIGKRKLEKRDDSESDLDISETNKRKKVHNGGMKDVMEDQPDAFVTVREVAKKKHKKKRLTIGAAGDFENVQEESEKKPKKKNHVSLPTELDGFEGGESVQNQEESSKKHKKNKSRPNNENELNNFVDQSFNVPPEASSSKEQEKRNRKNSIITSTQKDRPDSSFNDLNESIQDLLNFEQKKLAIPNIEREVAEEEININGLMRKIELKSSGSKEKKKLKKGKKAMLESENSQKKDRVKDMDVDDPIHIIKNFQKNNSMQKVDYCENGSFHNLKENWPCFFVKVPVDLDPNQLIGTNISLNKKAAIKIGDSEYKSSASQKETSFVVLGEKSHIHLEVSHLITMKLKSKTDDKEDLINGLLLEQKNIINSPKKQKTTSLEKSPVKSGKTNNIQQLDTFLKDGTKFLKDVKFISFRFKNEKLVADLDRQTNEVLKKQVEFLQEENTSTENYNKIKKELADETRELLQKRTNIINKGGSDGEMSDYF